MAVRLPPSFLGKATILHPAANDRLTILGAIGSPAPGQSATSNPLTVVSGALAGPVGTMGELTLVNSTTLRVNPARFLIQGTQSSLQGPYEVVNDAQVDLPITGQNASQYRRSLACVYVRDSSVAGGSFDDAVLTIIDGPLAASAGAAALPTGLPDNLLALGEVAIPPVGQTVTLTPYNPRTRGRNGILPVIADASTVAGHAGAAPAHDGDTRWHPTLGLQIGNAGAWLPSGLGSMFYQRGGASVAGAAAANPRVWAGLLDVAWTGVSYAIVNIGFPTGYFSEVPTVQVTYAAENQQAVYGGTDQHTVSGCIAVMRAGINITATYVGGLHVLAVGR